MVIARGAQRLINGSNFDMQQQQGPGEPEAQQTFGSPLSQFLPHQQHQHTALHTTSEVHSTLQQQYTQHCNTEETMIKDETSQHSNMPESTANTNSAIDIKGGPLYTYIHVSTRVNWPAKDFLKMTAP